MKGTMTHQEVREQLHTMIDYIMDGIESGFFEDLKIEAEPIRETIFVGEKLVIMGTVDMVDSNLKTMLPQIKGTRLLLEANYAKVEI